MKLVIPASLYGVFVGELEGQFSDGHWENSRYQDWKYMNYETVVMGDPETTPNTNNELPYNIRNFFRYCVKEKIDCIVDRVLRLYHYARIIADAYRTSPEDAEALCTLISGVDTYYLEIRESDSEKYRKYKEHNLELVTKYFGSVENYLKIDDGHKTTEEEYKLFTKIGGKLNKVFGKHQERIMKYRSFRILMKLALQREKLALRRLNGKR